MFEEIKDRLSHVDIFGVKTTYELCDIRASMVKFLISALFAEGLICSLGGVLMSNGLLALLGGANVAIAVMSYMFRAWLK